MDHYNPLFFSFFINTGEIKSIWHIYIQLYCCNLPFTTERIFCQKIQFWTIECRLTDSFKPITTFFCDNFAQNIFGLFPLIWTTKIFFRMCRIVKRQTNTHFKSKHAIKFMDNVPDCKKFFFRLRHSAKHMCVILGKGAETRKPGKLSRLFIAVTHGCIRISLWELAIAPLATRVKLRVMRAIHWLHRKFMPLASHNLEKIIAEFIPMAAYFIKLSFCDVGNLDTHISCTIA